MKAKSTKEPVKRRPDQGHARTSTGRAEGDGVTSTRRAAFTVPGLDREDAGKVIELLSDRLRSLIDLSLTLKHIHWNLVGPNFIAVHQMLDPQHAETSTMVDELAERIATMGGSPSGVPGALVRDRTWSDYSIGRASAQAHLAALDIVYTGIIESHRRAIGLLAKLDPMSQDLLIGHTRILEQNQWFGRAHLEDAAGGLSHAGTSTESDAATKVSNRQRGVGRAR